VANAVLATIQADISLQMTQVKTEDLILMMKRVTIMITDYIKRYAENINIKNDICDFSDLDIGINGISAVSWEHSHCSRRDFGAQLLKDMFDAVSNGDLSCIHVMVQLMPEQPDTAIVNYKKTWGLIEKPGLDVTSFQDKKSFIDKGSKGLILTGTCRISNFVRSEIQQLINSEEKVFFSNINPDLSDADTSQTRRLTRWINNILQNDGVIFFNLGRFDEKNAEVVAMGKRLALEKIS
jgi:hypothetical protein